MSLINRYGDANRVIETALHVVYSKRIVYGSWDAVAATGGDVLASYPQMWEIHRIASKSYRYVGMTSEAAQECAAAMKSLYTRAIRQSEWQATSSDNYGYGAWSIINGGSVVTADIAIQHISGSMYDVVVSVNEDDTRCLKYTDTTDADSGTLWGAERMRDYDGETEVTS